MDRENKLNLLYDFNAIEQLAEKGMDLLGGSLTDKDFRKLPNLITLVWAGSLHTNSEFSEDDARASLRGLPLVEVISNITSSLQISLGGEDAVDEEEVPEVPEEES
jgi:hypothetical protein